VHTNVDLYGGASNKNLGEAFLFVWKFPKSEVDIFDSEVNLVEGSPKVGYTVELAIISYVKCIAKIN
jgi:class 3 adenylate cyclase